MAKILDFVRRTPARVPAGTALPALLEDFSIEVMPRTAARVEDFRAILPAGTRVYLAHIDGTDFAGNIFRYGVGLNYKALTSCCWELSPVAEVVGWTVLDGQVSMRQPSGVPLVESAAGDTIVNAKLGLRFKHGERFDLYTGYGRPLTGDTWYDAK